MHCLIKIIQDISSGLFSSFSWIILSGSSGKKFNIVFKWSGYEVRFFLCFFFDESTRIPETIDLHKTNRNQTFKPCISYLLNHCVKSFRIVINALFFYFDDIYQYFTLFNFNAGNFSIVFVPISKKCKSFVGCRTRQCFFRYAMPCCFISDICNEFLPCPYSKIFNFCFIHVLSSLQTKLKFFFRLFNSSLNLFNRR